MELPDQINVRDIYTQLNNIKLGQKGQPKVTKDHGDKGKKLGKNSRSRETTFASQHSLTSAKSSKKSKKAGRSKTLQVMKIPELPSSKKTKKARRSKTLQLLKKRWEIPELPRLAEPHTSHYNSLDDATIYSRFRDDRNDILFRQASPMLPPLKVSPRFKEQGPDTQGLREKKLIIKYYERTGKLKQFENDRAVIPTVYPDYFECFSRKKSYVNDLYIKNYVAKNKMSMECFGKDLKPLETCQYCDVIGNKYCAFCIEIKNRNFAWGYESNFIPIDADSRASVVKQSMETFSNFMDNKK